MRQDRLAGVVSLAIGVYLALLAFVLIPMRGPGADDPRGLVNHIRANVFPYYLLALIGILAVLALPLLISQLNARLESGSPALIRQSSAMGYVGMGALLVMLGTLLVEALQFRAWSQQEAEQAVPAIGLITRMAAGLGIFALGLWGLLVGLAVIRHGGLPKALAWLGVIAGGLNLLIMVGPPIEFPLLIAWFIALGLVLLLENRKPAVDERLASESARLEPSRR